MTQKLIPQRQLARLLKRSNYLSIKQERDRLLKDAQARETLAKFKRMEKKQRKKKLRE